MSERKTVWLWLQHLYWKVCLIGDDLALSATKITTKKKEKPAVMSSIEGEIF